MNYSSVAAILSDKVKAVGVTFSPAARREHSANPSGRLFTYKTTLDLKVGDLVLVPVSDNTEMGKDRQYGETAFGMKVAEVAEVDADLEFSSNINYKWVIQYVDMVAYEKLLENEKVAIGELRKIERKQYKAKMVEALSEQAGSDVTKIEFDPLG